MITHTYNCALGKVHFMCIHDKIKDGKCLALQPEPVILIRLIMTPYLNLQALWLIWQKKKNDQHNKFFAYTIDELYFAVHVFYIAFLAEYRFSQVKYDTESQTYITNFRQTS